MLFIRLFGLLCLLVVTMPLAGAQSAEPICGAVGSRSERWERGPGGEIIAYANCAKCRAQCQAAGSRSEGWYSTCDGSLIEYALCGSVSGLQQFSDVDRAHENYDAIMYVRAKGYVQGYPDGTYRPFQRVTRAEFTKILIAATVDPAALTTCLVDTPANYRVFSDVEPDTWYEPYVCVAKNMQIIAGYNDGKFRPTNTISFVEAAKILVGSLRLADPGAVTLPTETWYRKYVVTLERQGAIPLSVDRFDHAVTRGELAEMLYRVQAGVTSKPTQTFAALDRPTPDTVTVDPRVCTAPAEIMSSGLPRYPTSERYRHLLYLGQFFTANDCGPERLKAMAGDIRTTRYAMGSRLVLNRVPTPDFEAVLKSVGFRCTGSPAACTEWSLGTTVTVEALLRLQPFATQVQRDDCVLCR